jgi:zinc protease
VLTSGRLSRLWRRLVIDDGLATSISASNDSRVEGGALWLFAECAQGADPARLEAAIHEEVARLGTQPIARDDLERARALLVTGEAFEGETVTDVAECLGEWAVDDDWHRAFDGCARHLSLDAGTLRAAAQKYLRPERRVVGWCVPREERAPSAAKSGRTARAKAARARA